MQSVAYAPDGTLFALTARGGELWAYPANGAPRVLVARATADNPLEGWLDVSPDGRWLAVSGLSDATLFKVGSLAPSDAAAPAADRCSLLSGWDDYRFPDLYFYQRTCFTGDSAFWVGRTRGGSISHRFEFRCWSLPDLTRFEYTRLPKFEYQHMTAAPGTSHVVVEGWSPEHNAVAFWRGDLARPYAPVTAPAGTTDECNGFRIGSDGRFYATDHGKVLIYSVTPDGVHLDLTVPLAHYTSTPELSLSADARRFVARSFRSKLVCAAEAATGEVLGPWDWNIGQVNDAAIAPDGLTAAAAGSSKKLVVWDLDR